MSTYLRSLLTSISSKVFEKEVGKSEDVMVKFKSHSAMYKVYSVNGILFEASYIVGKVEMVNFVFACG